jgi:DNA-3-methyladenine glycosylase II
MVMDQKILSHFQQRDEIIFKAIPLIEPFTLEKSDNVFFSLVESIISQQLSIKAGETIVKRFCSLIGETITPKAVLHLTKEQLRAIGMSWNKAEYVHNLAKTIEENQLNLDALDKMADEEVIRELTKIKGIGQWTAEMFLMFTLAREDVFSYGDVGLQNAIQRLYKLQNKPTKKQMEKLSKPWKPYRTYAARILWRSLSIEPQLL